MQAVTSSAPPQRTMAARHRNSRAVDIIVLVCDSWCAVAVAVDAVTHAVNRAVTRAVANAVRCRKGYGVYGSLRHPIYGITAFTAWQAEKV